MLRDSTQHLSGELDYVVTRPIRVQYTPKDGDIRDLPVGHVVPGEVAEAWPNRALNNLIWVGKLVPVPRGSQAGTGGDTPSAPSGEFELESLSDTQLDAIEALIADERARRAGASGKSEEPGGEKKPFELVALKGGYYELSDGSKVRGKNKALAAQAALDATAANEA